MDIILNVKISKELKKAAKGMAHDQDKTFRQFLAEALKEKLDREKYPRE